MMQVPSGEFSFSPIPSVVFGPGSVQRVREKVEELGGRRALVVTGRTLATKTDLVEQVKSALGDRCAGVFTGAKEHAPRQCVLEGARMAKEVRADVLVSVGGSSPSDVAKGINLVVNESEYLDDFFVKYDRSDATKVPKFEKPKFPLIAIPTTLSAGEFTSVTGITDTQRKHKDVYNDVGIIAKVVILDPEMTALTPKELWAGTGMKLLADRLGMVCAPQPLPLAEALGLHAIRLINQYIVRSVGEPLDLQSRAMLLHAVWMSPRGTTGGASGRTSGLGMVAAFRHQIGAGYGVPHGVASTIVLPHCIDFNRPLIDERLVAVARALDLPIRGISDTASAVVDRVSSLTRELGIPARLRDVGIPKDALPAIAESAWMDASSRNNVRPVDSSKQLASVLEQAW